MSGNPHERLVETAATLIARQKSVLSRCKANGWDHAVAESLLAAMERSERLLRSRSRSERTGCRALDPSFLSSVAHDLRNHLQSLKLDLDSTQHSIARGAAADLSAGHEIEGGLSMMNLLSHDLLIASKMQDRGLGLRVRPHSVARLLGEVANVLAPIARLSEVHLHVAPVPRALHVRCDWDRLRHAIASLVLEIAKETRPGGRVSISARRSGDTVRFALSTDAARSAKHNSSRAWLATALIEAQGGRVWSGKAVGRDSHICFTMPSSCVELRADRMNP